MRSAILPLGSVALVFSIGCLPSGSDPDAGTPDANPSVDGSAPSDVTSGDAADGADGSMPDGLSFVTGALGAPGLLDDVGKNARLGPAALALDDANGKLFLCSQGRHAQVVDLATGRVELLAGAFFRAGPLDGPKAVAAFEGIPTGGCTFDNASQTIFFGESGTIRGMGTNGSLSTLTGNSSQLGHVDGSKAQARFLLPRGMAYDAASHVLYVVDDGVRAVNTMDGSVTTPWLAGSDYVDGPPSVARLRFPMSLALNPTAKVLYVLDGSTIRALDIGTGVVSTLAGSKTQSGSTDGPKGVGTMEFSSAVGTIAFDGTSGTLYVPQPNGVIRTIDVATGVLGTLAGVAGQRDSVDGVGSGARFCSPTSVLLRAPTLFVSDTCGAIRAVNISTKTVTTAFGSPSRPGVNDGASGKARFSLPWALAYDATWKTAYVADMPTATIRAIDLSTATTSTVGGVPSAIGCQDGPKGSNDFTSPTGVALNPATHVAYVADGACHAIRTVDSNGNVGTLVGVSTVGDFVDGPKIAARLRTPYSVDFDAASQRLFFDDYGVIRQVDVSTTVVTSIAGSKQSAGHTDGANDSALFGINATLSYDSASQRLYVGEQDYQVVRVVDLVGKVTTTLAGKADTRGWTDGPPGTALFWQITSIQYDPVRAVLYVRDVGRIRVVDVKTGNVTTLLGKPETAGVRLGPIGNASLNAFGAIARVADGDLLIAETYESSILRLRGF